MVEHHKKISHGYLVVLDIGSTYLKCTTYSISQFGQTRADLLPLQEKSRLYPQCMATVRADTPSRRQSHESVEIDPETVTERTTRLIQTCLSENNVKWNEVIALGIACQRNTFLVWNAKTERCLTPFISWKDARSTAIATSWNSSGLVNLVRMVGRCVNAFITWNTTLVWSGFCFRPTHILPRMLWARQNLPDVDDSITSEDGRIVTLDSWLLSKLTEDRDFLIDYSSASSWGFFNPATIGWSRRLMWLFQIPQCSLPSVCPTIHAFGWTSLLDRNESPKAITTMIADQAAAAFGHGLTDIGDCKVTLGTGAFITVNSNSKLIFNYDDDVYTTIGWKLPDTPAVFLTETSVSGYGNKLASCSNDLFSLHTSDGMTMEEIDGILLTHLESFSPVQNSVGKAICGLIEIASLIVDKINVMTKYVDIRHPVRLDGGLTNSKMLLRIIATLLGEPVAKSSNAEMTSFGAALLCGIQAGLWTFTEVAEMRLMNLVDYEVFHPAPEQLACILKNYLQSM